jgi:hypothetical protein
MFILACVVFVPVAFYINNVGEGFSSISKNWGDFGSYLSGTISSIISPLSLIAITFTIVIQLNDNRTNSYLNQRESYINSIDIYINRARENFSYDEIRHEANIKNEYINSLARKAKKRQHSELLEELNFNIDSYGHLVDLEKIKAEYLSDLDELMLIKHELYILKGESTKKLSEIYSEKFGKFLTSKKLKID